MYFTSQKHHISRYFILPYVSVYVENSSPESGKVQCCRVLSPPLPS